MDRKEVDQMIPRDYQQASLMVSESETEEELIFDSSKDQGAFKNGDVQIKSSQNIPNGRITSDQQANT